MAVAVTFGDAGPAYRVVASHDGGATFASAHLSADAGDLITGVEIAAGDSKSIDLALAHGGQLVPTLARSVDGGATWALFDLGAALGTDQIRILAIDPVDATGCSCAASACPATCWPSSTRRRRPSRCR